MRTLQFWAFLFGALACMSVGLEVERVRELLPKATGATPAVEAARRSEAAPAVAATTKDAPKVGVDAAIDWGSWVRMLPLELPVSWEPLRTREVWERMAPTSLGWFEALGGEQIHDGVWKSVFLPTLRTPPAVWLTLLALLSLLLARLRTGQQVPSPGGLRTVIRLSALGVAALGFITLGADLYRSGGAWQTRSIVELWALLDPSSLERFGASPWISGVLAWPAWLGLALLGGVAAYLTRPRPDLVMYPYPPPGNTGPIRFIDVSRTLSYLDSMRSWPRGRRGRGRGEIEESEAVDPRHLG